MYDETRKAVRTALDIGKTLFGLGPEKYQKLVEATRNVQPPTREEIQELKEQGMSFGEAVEGWFRKAYATAAVEAGFGEEHGLAMLTYAALLKDMEQ